MTKYLIQPYINLDTFVGVFSQLAFCGLSGISIYLIFARLFRLEEFYSIKSFFSSKLFRFRQTIPEDPTEASGI
jgi:hypothetical protein